MRISLKIGRFIFSIGLIPKSHMDKSCFNMVLTKKDFNRIEKLAMFQDITIEEWMGRMLSVGINYQESCIKSYVDDKVLDFLDK